MRETNDLYSKFYAIDFHSNLRVTEYLKIEVTVKKNSATTIDKQNQNSSIGKVFCNHSTFRTTVICLKEIFITNGRA